MEKRLKGILFYLGLIFIFRINALDYSDPRNNNLGFWALYLDSDYQSKLLAKQRNSAILRAQRELEVNMLLDRETRREESRKLAAWAAKSKRQMK